MSSAVPIDAPYNSANARHGLEPYLTPREKAWGQVIKNGLRRFGG
jgi:hypothetical protein